MSNSINLYYLFALPGCLIAGLLYAWLLYGHSMYLAKKMRYGLAALRMLVVAILLWLLCAPLVKRVSYTLEKPVIIIGQDNSLSVRNEPSEFNRMRYEKDMKTLAGQLSQKYDVRIYHFSDSLKAGFDFSNQGKLTNASNFIRTLNDEFLNRNVGAVIMATDGIFNRGGNPLYDLNKLKAPVYTIALGDTIPKRDVLISNVNYNSLVYLDNDFTIEVQIEAFESKGGRTQLSVLENGKKVKEEQVVFSGDPFVKSIPIKLKATSLGLQKYTISLSALKDEVSVKNNAQSILVEVIDDRQKVLIASAAPHPDLGALKQAIELNKHYEAKVVLNEDLNAINVADYGLVILYQLPGIQFDASSFIQKVQAGKASLWYILGAQSNINRFNQIQKLVSLNGNPTMLQDLFGHVNPDFTAFNLNEASKKVMEQYDPLQAPFGKLNVNVSHTAVLFQRIGKINTPVPLLFFTNTESKKTGYLVGEGLWRWKLSETKDGQEPVVFNQLVSQIIQYLSVKDDKRKFKVYAAKTAFDENEQVILNADLYNDSYLPLNTPDATIQIKDGQSKTYNFSFSKSGSAYQLDAGLLPAGNYTYVATTKLGNQRYTVRGAFFVNALVAEYQQTIANHQLLYTMSAQTNGKMYLPENLLKLVADLEQNDQVKTLSYEDRKYEDLISFKWLFAGIMTLLTLEWFFRKRNGEI